jgi:sugar phosphate isomerase/epimerase
MSGNAAFLPGLCSVTFQRLAVDRVIALAAEAGARGIEWCSAIHVLPGSRASARRIAASCRDAGLDVPSYGSYVRAGADDEQQEIGAVLDTAAALGARNVRVWAGRLGSRVAGEAERARVADAVRDYAELAATRSVALSIEYHRDTLTDTLASALRLLHDVNHPNCFTYWQPVPGMALEAAVAQLRALGQALSHLHVFHWQHDDVRRPLEEGEAFWQRLVDVAGECSSFGRARYAFSEFIRNDDPEQFRRDFRVLARLLGHGAVRGAGRT